MKVMKQDISRLVLGTAQLGMEYGIANVNVYPAYQAAMSIVEEAWEQRLREFDTAQAYGESEKVLGRIIKDLRIADEVKVITKIAPYTDHLNRIALNKAIEISMENLGVEILYGVLLHQENMLDLWEKGLGKYLNGLIGTGRVKHIGVSTYSPEKAIRALHTEGISIIQIPTNVIDRRFEKAGVFDLAVDLGKTIYIRSIFLQGLLLMSPESLPKKMQFTAPVLKRYALLAQDVGINFMELCIGYVKHAFPHSKIIFGAETKAQVRENLECWTVTWSNELTQRIQREFDDVDETILSPSLWQKGHVDSIS